jgi:hypothetical protein
MQDDSRQAAHSAEASREARNSLSELRERMDEHISALHDVGRSLLERQDDAGALVPRGIRVNIAIGGEPGPERQAPSTWCYTETYLCGEGASGYLTCTVDVCMEVGPVTIRP